MRCPKCGKTVELQKKQVGVDESGTPVFNEYAICRDCKKQWNLDKQRAKKAENTHTSNNTEPAPTKTRPAKPQAEKREPSNTSRRAQALEKTTAPIDVSTEKRKPAAKKPTVPPARKAAGTVKSPERKYGNVPPEKIRVKKEAAAKQNYEDMLATESGRKPAVKRKTAPEQSSVPRKRPVSSQTAAKRKPAVPPKRVPVKKEEPLPKFRILRIIFGILSIAAFVFFAYKAFITGLSNISSGNKTSTGTTFIVLALCMLVSGLLLLIMQKKRSIFAFILPFIFYIGGAVFAFLKRGNDKWLVFGAVIGALFGIIFIVLTVASASRDEKDYESDYYDAFEDDDY